MKKIYLIFGAFIFTFLLISCDAKDVSKKNGENTITVENSNPTPEEILKENKDADIFLIDDVVYENAENSDWVMELDLTLGDKLGEIQKNSNDRYQFENFTATKLPVGTEIYSVEKHEDILIAIVDNKQIRYVGLFEG